jgi:hypothetical protein
VFDVKNIIVIIYCFKLSQKQNGAGPLVGPVLLGGHVGAPGGCPHRDLPIMTQGV